MEWAIFSILHNKLNMNCGVYVHVRGKHKGESSYVDIENMYACCTCPNAKHMGECSYVDIENMYSCFLMKTLEYAYVHHEE